MRRVTALILGVAAILIISALAGDHPALAGYGPVPVEITDIGYSPSTLTIPPSTTVTWVNRGSTAHTVTADSGRPQSPLLDTRGAYSYTFHSEGTFAYHDKSNPQLTGTIVVVAGAELPTPPPVPTPTPAAPPEPAPSAAEPPLAGGAAQTSAAVPGASDQGENDTPRAPVASDGTVVIEAGNEWFGDASFQGGVHEVAIHVGDSIQWTVIDGIHNAYECGLDWADVSSSCSSAAWHSDQVLTAGSAYLQNFDTAGTFYYLCTIHPLTMRGKVTVEGGDAGGAVDDATDTNEPPAEDPADPVPAVEEVAENPGSSAAPAVAAESALPKGGGAPPEGEPASSTWTFVAAAVVFAASGLSFWRWRHVSRKR